MNINILDHLDTNGIILGIKQKNKKFIITSIIEHLVLKGKIDKKHKSEILKSVLQREDMGSTAIGSRIAFPHTRINCVKNIIVCIGISKEGVDFDSLDQEPVNVIALLLSNQKEAGLHLKMLAFLARMLRDKYLVQRLKSVKTEEGVLTLLNKQQEVVR
ncbi:MAG: PTS sugar transporter subunit IIA [Candidatus Omnitrophica bacterium]|nr:PTS sugar transporter subunit IIA [Candidatus Omnitrophota bacterium]